MMIFVIVRVAILSSVLMCVVLLIVVYANINILCVVVMSTVIVLKVVNLSVLAHLRKAIYRKKQMALVIQFTTSFQYKYTIRLFNCVLENVPGLIWTFMT